MTGQRRVEARGSHHVGAQQRGTAPPNGYTRVGEGLLARSSACVLLKTRRCAAAKESGLCKAAAPASSSRRPGEGRGSARGAKRVGQPSWLAGCNCRASHERRESWERVWAPRWTATARSRKKKEKITSDSILPSLLPRVGGDRESDRRGGCCSSVSEQRYEREAVDGMGMMGWAGPRWATLGRLDGCQASQPVRGGLPAEARPVERGATGKQVSATQRRGGGLAGEFDVWDLEPATTGREAAVAGSGARCGDETQCRCECDEMECAAR